MKKTRSHHHSIKLWTKISLTQSRRKTIRVTLYSLLASAILLIGCYAFDNMAYPFGEDTKKFTVAESLIRRIKYRIDYDDVVFVNLAYDPALVTTENGKEKITDRDTLLQVLKDLQGINYRYIFIDIRFEEGLVSDCDSALVNQIMNMRDVLVAKHWDYENKRDYPLIADTLLLKSAYCDFTVTLMNTAFNRYQFNQANGPSAALAMFRGVDCGDLECKRFGPCRYYTDGKGHLCLNSLPLVIPHDFSAGYDPSTSEAFFWNRWEDIYSDSFSKSSFFNFAKGKIICLGDFSFDDMHDTYFGSQPGTYIHYLAYRSLQQRKNVIKWWLVLLLLAVYTTIFVTIYYQKDLTSIPAINRIKSKFVHFVVSLAGYSVVLTLCCLLLYLISDIIISIFIPTVVFSLYTLIIKYRHYET